ncbi:MAG: MaoC family dehydratase [Sphingomonadales bacterium]|nr:MaoC family dehydratase [Sphingomonadales bacterium]
MAAIVEKPQDLLGMVGTKFGPTDWVRVDQARVNAFADCTGDHQWIHVDVERAQAGPFGGTIAHGYLTMSMINLFLPQLLEVRGFAHAVNVGLDKLRFLAPVVTGRRVRAISEVVSAEEMKGGIQAVVRVTIEIEGSDRPALVADTISRYFPEGTDA